MIINDIVYGKSEIKEPILMELINSPSMQRLKGISQLGMPEEFYFMKGFSRNEHSIGVSIFLKKIGASLEEQIAGLIHDHSHTAFSHVIDWVIGDPSKEDHQDNTLFNYLKNSEIPEILHRYNININKIYDFEAFGLLEREAPSLCADRFDYSIREMALNLPKSIIEKIVQDISSEKEQLFFKTKEIAEFFGRNYLNLQINNWGGKEARSRYLILANSLKIALENKFISFEDFYKTDYEVLEILAKTENKLILNQLNMLKKGFIIKEDNNGILLKKKFRYIDPEVKVNEKIKSLSTISKSYKKLLDEEKENSKKEIKVIFLNKPQHHLPV